MARALTLVAGVVALGAAGPAAAQADLFSRGTVSGVVEARIGWADGEESWARGGFGKLQFGDGADVTGAASLEWRPKLTWELGAVISLEVQPDLEKPIDLGEAYVTYKPVPHSELKLQARAGVFYPPVSLEHDGPAWSLTRTFSASAINSWIAEEVKVGGLELKAAYPFGGHELALTGAIFGWNDTSGTILTFRGWALHGLKATPGGEFELPPLSPFAAQFQPGETYPVRELDNRAGYYGRLEWRPPAPMAFEALYYDNAGNRVAVDADGQWAWETRFLSLGATAEVGERWKLQAQAMNGETLMGFKTPEIWFEMGFRAVYVMATYERERGDALSARIDWFATADRTWRAIDDNAEQGWALTATYRRALTERADFLVEATHVRSERGARRLEGLAPVQNQSGVQTGVRFSF